MSNKNRKRGTLKKVQSRELRSGSLYRDCDCYRRNGLQHDCPRTECNDSKCELMPWPECDLGCHFINKWYDSHTFGHNCKTNGKEGSNELKNRTDTVPPWGTSKKIVNNKHQCSQDKTRPLRGRFMLPIKKEIQ